MTQYLGKEFHRRAPLQKALDEASIKESLKKALEEEEDGIKQYAKMIASAEEPACQAMLTAILQDEQRHAEMLRNHLNAMSPVAPRY